MPTGLPSLLFPLPPSPSPPSGSFFPLTSLHPSPPPSPYPHILTLVFLRYAILLPHLRKETHLGQDLELFPPLVKVDEAVGDDVRDGRVDHRQVGEEGAQVWYRAIAVQKIVFNIVFLQIS